MVKRRHRKRLKNNHLIIVFIILIGIAALGIYKNHISKKEDVKPSHETVIPKPDENKIEEKKTYLKKTVNTSGVAIKKEWENLIVNYLDLYTKSLVTLNKENVKELFTNPDGDEAYLTDATIDFQVEHHKLGPNDMKLNYAAYEIEYKNVYIDGNKVTIKFLEDDYYKFNFMDNESRIIDVENTIVLNKSEDKYTIDSLRVVRDNYVMFTNVVTVGSSSFKTTVDNLKNKYLNWDREEVEKNKNLLKEANENKYTSSKTCDNEYNREDAVSYANKYADGRNSKYYDYSNLGGNCANYGSQAIQAGGIPNDYIGAYQWKYYSSALNTSNTEAGRSNSWTSTNYFYDYAKNNTGYGMCAVTDINIFYAEGGDIIQVGYNGYTHTTIAIGQIIKDGKIVDIAINSNTVGLENYPLMGYTYHNKRLIKILGYND